MGLTCPEYNIYKITSSKFPQKQVYFVDMHALHTNYGDFGIKS